MSDNLTPNRFAEFFEAVHGCEHKPFPWQQRLAEDVIQGEWPDVIDIPTGCGKSAALDIAVFALAANPEIMPRRIAVVVDRRIIVDQLHSRAETIAEKIKSRSSPVLADVAASLQRIAGEDEICEESLKVSMMRGGAPIDNSWAIEPHRPWIIASTVDQLGSRILHRGYGVSPSMRPIHAGLAGNDILIILDEVHLSAPFAQTLKEIELLHQERGDLPNRFKIVQMSATAADENSRNFNLTASDIEKSEELARRANAKKSISITETPNRKSLPRKVASLVKYAAKGDAKTIGVIANRVASAREIFTHLKDAGIDARLITGRMRPIDIEIAVEEIAELTNPDREYKASELTVIVSTQAIEVGADFSFDELITECAPADSLTQRIGRLDRRGLQSVAGNSPPTAHVVGIKQELNSRLPDPIYGAAVKETWTALQEIKNPTAKDLKEIAENENALAPRLEAPLMLRTHAQAFCQTNPEPVAQPQVHHFLHGLDSNVPAEVSIIWRLHRSKEALIQIPPRTGEVLAVPINAARAWLANAPEPAISDTTQSVEETVPRQIRSTADKDRKWIIWDPAAKNIAPDKEADEPFQASDIKPGDLIVAAPEIGGISSCNWNPHATENVPDLGDHAQREFVPKLRLDHRLELACRLNHIAPGNMPRPNDNSSENQTEAETAQERVEKWLTPLYDLVKDEDPLKDALIAFQRNGIAVANIGECYIVSPRGARHASAMDGSDETNSLSGTPRPIALKEHMAGVGARAERYARALNLDDKISHDLNLAGRYHDIGKADLRFQMMLSGGDPITYAAQEELLAKSIIPVTQKSEYPPHMRHEAASVALLQSDPHALKDARDPDLVLHLIAAHHGYARPLPQIIPDSNPQTIRYDRMQIDSDLSSTPAAVETSNRFNKMIRRYGIYGLAWLEAILRLADHRQSEEEARLQ